MNKEMMPPVRKSIRINEEDKEKTGIIPFFPKNTCKHSEQTSEDERKPDSVVA